MRKYVDALYQSYGSRLFETTTFILFFWLVLGYFHLNSNLDQMIYGPHYWRQADGLAQAMNYTKNGLDFFDHSLYYNQFNGSAKAVGEFPLMYYLVAIQKTLFGGDLNLLFRINHIVLGFFGLLALFKISNHYIKNLFVSIGLTFILFCSPVFSFYFLASMPDPVAFNLSLIGYWMLIKYYHHRKSRYLLFGMIWLSIAFMVKFYFIIPFLAFILIALINKYFKISKHCYLPVQKIMVLPIICGVGWLFYMAWYNGQSDCNCYLGSVMPIWDATPGQMERIGETLHNFRFDFLAKHSWWIFLGALSYNLVNWTRETALHNLYIIVAILGGGCFFLLFYQMFEHHDYYIYPLIFLLPIVVGLAIVKIRSRLRTKQARFQLAFLFLTLVMMEIQEATPTFEKRIWSLEMNHSSYYEGYRNAECLLRENGVNQEDLVLSLSDHTPNYSLVLMDQQGWSGYQSFYLQWPMQEFLNRGVDYMIVNERLKLWDVDSYAQDYKEYLVAQESDLYVYDLRPYRQP